MGLGNDIVEENGKTNLGIEAFDAAFGGIHRGRTTLCCGRRHTGKSILAYRFLHQSFLDGDRSLLLTDHQAKDVLIVAEAADIPFGKMLQKENLTILEYSTHTPGETPENSSPLPPTAFLELKDIIDSRSIRRIVFDSVIPWLATHPFDRVSNRVQSFISAMKRLNITTLVNLPWPASTPAFALKNRLEDLCPIVLVTDKTEVSARDPSFRVTKYVGGNLSASSQMVFPINASSRRGTPGFGLNSGIDTASVDPSWLKHMSRPPSR